MENEKEGKYKKVKIAVISIILALIIITSIILINRNSNSSTEKVFTITYISVEEENSSVYAKFKIETNADAEFQIKASSFAVLINKNPASANGIVKGLSSTMTPNGFSLSYIVGNDLNISGSKEIIVIFDYTMENIDNPLTFLYEGKELEFGKKIQFTIN